MGNTVKNRELSAPEKIKRALEKGEKLTGMDILMRFNCMNYKGRIHDLRRDGYPVKTEMIKLDSGKTVALYSKFIPQFVQTQLF